ncbi:hypothetical protein ACQKM2_07160 [Streptomyces sp. NPDC004126]|uniref:hypothetical protein n=1 Tax=Streptomyces sp. NPDC004126 TaxID=3390695 RepID=UPI003D05D544
MPKVVVGVGDSLGSLSALRRAAVEARLLEVKGVPSWRGRLQEGGRPHLASFPMERGSTGSGPERLRASEEPRTVPPASRSDAEQDAEWAGERRSATVVAGLLVAGLQTIDWAADSTTWQRGVVWTGLGLLLCVVLLPPRVRVAAQRLILRDAEGRRAEIDPGVLARNPALWHGFDTDARASVRRGTLSAGGTATLRHLAEHIDREAARSVFKVSGLG